MENLTFEDKTIFLTGGSGFLGTALVSKLVLNTSCPKIILLCRGGLKRLHQVWQNTLPPHIFAQLCENPRIEVFDGDICMENLGMDNAVTLSLRDRVNIVIHTASSINLRRNLERIAPPIIQGTLNVANFALSCTTLHRFVYISTAYANAHLHHLNPKNVAQISECVHPLRDKAGSVSDAELEWLHLQKYGTTPEFEATPFPWAYAYAKHLTERLLIGMFLTVDHSTTSETSFFERSSNITEQGTLLIVRPSIIGPADSFPVSGWQVATSAPVTALLAFLILTPSRKLGFYSQFEDPSREAIIDEVPVDIVVNRIIIHTSTGASGIVHANRKVTECYRWTDYLSAAQRIRRLPWNTKIRWHEDSTSPKLSPIAKLYQVGGCTYEFADTKSSNLWSVMTVEEQQIFPLFAAANRSVGSGLDLSSRDEAFRELLATYLRKRKWPLWLSPIFYR